MKVLYIADQYSHGGAAAALIEMIVLLREKYGVEAIVGTAFNNALAEELDKNEIQHICLGHRQFAFNYDSQRNRIILFLKKPFYKLRYILANRKAMANAKRNLNFNEIDIVHSNVDRNDIGGIIARKFKIPHCWHIREFRTGHFNLIFNRKKPCAYMNKMTDCYICISDSVLKSWVSSGLSATKSKMIYDGVDFMKSDNHKAKLSDSQLCIVCVGEITKAKGQHLLIEAVAVCEKKGIDVCLDFYGNGDETYVSYLKNKVVAGGLEKKVSFKGFCKNIQSFLSNYDAGVNPSSGEGFGRTSVEYMGAGLVTVLKKDRVSSEVFGEDRCGLYFSDPNELADQLIWIFENRERARELAVSAKKRARELFDINRNIEDIYTLYEELISERDKRN